MHDNIYQTLPIPRKGNDRNTILGLQKLSHTLGSAIWVGRLNHRYVGISNLREMDVLGFVDLGNDRDCVKLSVARRIDERLTKTVFVVSR
jgi:hypothetical protein